MSHARSAAKNPCIWSFGKKIPLHVLTLFLLLPSMAQSQEITFIVQGEQIECVRMNKEKYLKTWDSVIFLNLQDCPDTNLDGFFDSTKNEVPNFRVDPEKDMDNFLSLSRSDFICLMEYEEFMPNTTYQLLPSTCSIVAIDE